MKTSLVSYHGGHSGQFCNHAEDTLEDIILKYIELGFARVGITEHIPPVNDRFLYPDEIADNLNSHDLYLRFRDYFSLVRRLKEKYADRILIMAGMETETYTGYIDHVHALVSEFSPDYIVGSVHHVGDICFDYSKDAYDRAASACGSLEGLYESYFDLQYEMMAALRPFIVGHFDLIRIYDPAYHKRLARPKIQKKIHRNLKLIQSLGLVMDFNLRPLSRGEAEPYIAPPILEQAKEMGIRVVPGDDSHAVDQAGANIEKAIAILTANGFNTTWPLPELHPADSIKD